MKYFDQKIVQEVNDNYLPSQIDGLSPDEYVSLLTIYKKRVNDLSLNQIYTIARDGIPLDVCRICGYNRQKYNWSGYFCDNCYENYTHKG